MKRAAKLFWSLLAALLMTVLAADPENRPAVTAIDVLYAGRTSEAADRRLAQAAASLGNVVTAAAADSGGPVHDGLVLADSSCA